MIGTAFNFLVRPTLYTAQNLPSLFKGPHCQGGIAGPQLFKRKTAGGNRDGPGSNGMAAGNVARGIPHDHRLRRTKRALMNFRGTGHGHRPQLVPLDVLVTKGSKGKVMVQPESLQLELRPCFDVLGKKNERRDL